MNYPIEDGTSKSFPGAGYAGMLIKNRADSRERLALFYMANDLLPVDKPVLMQLYHVAWSRNNGIVGKCVSIDTNAKTVILRRPKTKELFKYPVAWRDLRHTRRTQNKITNDKNINRPSNPS